MYSCKSVRAHAVPASNSKAFSRCCRRVSFAVQQQVSPSRRKRDVARHGLFGLGVPEIAVIAGVAALIFGPSKLPELGKAAGQTAKSFQDAAKEFNEELKKGLEEGETQPTGEAKTEIDQVGKAAATEKEPETAEKKKE